MSRSSRSIRTSSSSFSRGTSSSDAEIQPTIHEEVCNNHIGFIHSVRVRRRMKRVAKCVFLLKIGLESHEFKQFTEAVNYALSMGYSPMDKRATKYWEEKIMNAYSVLDPEDTDKDLGKIVMLLSKPIERDEDM